MAIQVRPPIAFRPSPQRMMPGSREPSISHPTRPNARTMANEAKDPTTILAALSVLITAIAAGLQRLGFRFKRRVAPRSDRGK